MRGSHAEDERLENQGEAVTRESWAVWLLPWWAALVAMAPFVGVLAGGNEFFHDDHFRFSTPIAGMFAEALRAHHLPLWNPWILTGTPLVAERGSMIAHPGMFLALFMQPSHAVGTLMVVLLGVLAAGSTALLRALRVRSVLAIAVGAAIGLSGPALSYTSNAPFLATLAFWPLVLLSALRLAEGKGSMWSGGLALGLALLGGDLPGALLAAVVAVFVFRAGGGRLATQWPRLVATGAIALVVGAGSWYPVLWALPISERGAGIAASEAGKWSFHPAEILGFIWPHPLGLPLPRFTFWPFRWLGRDRLFLHSIWVGSVVSAASVLALRRGSERVARTLVIAALVLLVVATGEWTPLWVILRPIFTFVRYPSKLAGPAALLVALAGAVVVERLLARPRGLRNLCLWVAGLGALGALAGTLVQSMLAQRAAAPPAIVQAAASALRLDTARVALLAAAGASLFLLVERGRLSLARAAALLSALLFLDVFSTTADLAWTRATVTPARPAYLPEAGPRGPRVMRLEEVSTGRLALDEKAFSEEQLRHAALLSPMTNVLQHASVLDPYGLYVGEVATAMAEMTGSNPLAFAEVSATDVMLAAPGSRAPWLAGAVASRRLLPVAASAAGAVVLRPTRALPRSFLTSAASLVAREEIPRRLAQDAGRVLVSRGRGLRGGGFVALDALAVPPALLAEPSRPPAALAPIAWRPGEAAYRVVTPTPALLVEMDAFAPGWRVYVDGEERNILQANVFGRAVVVPAGAHAVKWRFFPRLPVASLFASWFAVCACVVALLPRRRRE
jgi:hypothetical protein